MNISLISFLIPFLVTKLWRASYTKAIGSPSWNAPSIFVADFWDCSSEPKGRSLSPSWIIYPSLRYSLADIGIWDKCSQTLPSTFNFRSYCLPWRGDAINAPAFGGPGPEGAEQGGRNKFIFSAVVEGCGKINATYVTLLFCK